MLGSLPLLPALLLAIAPANTPAGSEKRCGWVVNPTPGNLWLIDAKQRWNTGWLVSSQGGYQARGIDTLPDMTTNGWVSTNGNYGYGCGCMQVRVDRRNRQVTRVYGGAPLPLAQCRRDPALPRPPRNP